MTIATTANTRYQTAGAPALAIEPRVTAGITPRLAGVPEARLAEAFADCGRITKARARNFFYGLRLTPEPRRSAIYAIYAWMRAADDEADADSPLAQRRDRLRRLRELTDLALEARLYGTPLADELPVFWPAFAATVVSYSLDPALFHAMLDGLEEDLEHTGYPTDADLYRYCYRVASTVGLACITIWGTRPGVNAAEVQDLAIRRGQAFQRTNILRDYAQDFDSVPSRVYLPADALASAGLTPSDLRAWTSPDRCAGLISAQAAIARRYYRESAALESMIDPACRPTLWAMTRIYSGLLRIIENDPARVVGSRRIRLASHRKIGIAVLASLRARLARPQADA